MRPRKSYRLLFLIPFLIPSTGLRAKFTEEQRSTAPQKVAGPVSPRQIAEQTFRSVVLLVTEDRNGQPVALASGFVVGEGVVATNLHVIEGATGGYAKLVGRSEKYEIRGILARDAARDLVLLAVPITSAPPVSFGEASEVAVGDEVYAVGNPRGLEGTFSQGMISGIRRFESEYVFQCTAPISPGSSGGPILNSQGKVIGVATATFRGGQNLNFAVPISYVLPLLTNAGRVIPLASPEAKTQSASIFGQLGERISTGVTGVQFSWGADAYYDSTPDFSFTLRNQLRESVGNIYYLVIFYDKEGEPIHFVENSYMGSIPPGLAKRVVGNWVDRSVYSLSSRREIRVLNFKIAE